ncbi:VanZ family protein [Candidatus Corynebacterium faecigallinarum]|uniref:VanZ family protein n=1 Tax=Candidatus Corynebacterium faecigallinarum TaxID=2838528 RepID=UPI003FD1E35F
MVDLGAGRTLLRAAALIYFWAIWSYTLLPLPDGTSGFQCAGTNTDPLQSVDTLRVAVRRPGDPLTDPGVLQLALNVLLFIPLGFLVRVLGGRGIPTAVLAGLGTSLLIEFTQLTGVWGIYDCAYRVFDVDDLITNTVGALCGSLLALVVPRRHRGMAPTQDAGEPRPVTRGGRLLAILCDWLGFTLVSVSVSVSVQLILDVTGQRDAVLEGEIASLVGPGVALVIWPVAVLTTGATIGDLAVQLRYRGGALPPPLSRPLRYLGGIGGYGLLGLIPGIGWVSWLFAVVCIVLVFVTQQGRDLPGLVSGQELVDARQR